MYTLIGGKDIKKAPKILILLAALMVIIPSVAFLLVENSRFQTYVTTQVLHSLSTKFGSKFSVEKVKLNILNSLTLEGVLITDQQFDTLLYVPKLRINLDSLNFRSKNLGFDHISFYDPDVRITQNQDSVFNYQFLIDSLKGPDSVRNKPWNISPGALRIYNGKISMNSPFMPLNIHHDIHLSEFNLNVQLKNIKPDSIHIQLKRLNFKEQYGFDLKGMKTEFVISPNQLTIKDLRIQTKHTDVNVPLAQLKGNRIFDSKENLSKAKTTFKIKDSEIALSDLSVLYAQFSQLNNLVQIEGEVSGSLNFLDFKDFLLEMNEVAYLQFNGEILDVLNSNEMFLYVNFKNLFIKTPLFTKILNDLHIGKNGLYDKLNRLGNVSYSGDFTGLPGNYVTYGKFKTALGQLKTDLELKTNHNDQLSFSGNLETSAFNLSSFTKNDKLLGSATMSIGVEGLFENNVFQGMNIDGFVEKIEVNKYAYTNTDLRGFLGHNLFNGAMSVNDPNLNFIFSGRVDFSEALPVFIFEADVKNANPGKLNLSKKFPNSDVSFSFGANITGNHPDNFDGLFRLKDFSYKNKNGDFSIDSLLIEFMPTLIEPKINISSNILNGNITGNYHLGALYNSARSILFDYLPALKSNEIDITEHPFNNFNFALNLKPIDTIAYILEQPYFLYEGMELSGMINDKANEIEVKANIPMADIKGLLIKDFELQLKNIGKERLRMISKATEINLTNNRKIENFSINSSILKDSIDLKWVWNNNDFVTNSGNIASNITFKRDSLNILHSRIHFNPSSIILADSQWHIPTSNIFIANNRYFFNDFKIQNGDRFFNINGIASKTNTDSIQFNINNFDLLYIQNLLHPKRITFNGVLNGKTTINGLLGNPLVQANLEIENFTFNDVYIGHMDLNSDWDETDKVLNVELTNNQGVDTPLFAKGSYTPAADSIDLQISLHKFRADILRPFIEKVVQNAKGLGSGNIALKGGLKSPYFEGTIFVENAYVDIDYLKTNYTFSDSIELGKDFILFKDLTIYDKDKNSGSFKGILHHQQFRNMTVDLHATADNMLVLNTQEKDNGMYYGTIYSSGAITISGPSSNIIMEANMTTMPNSTISFPINSASNAIASDFITYVADVPPAPTEKNYRKVNTTVEEEPGVFTVILGVNATADAKAELIFDQTVGDVIKGQGTGLINMTYVSNGDFNMTGEYTITKGDYLFTMLNMINKSFSLEPGGTIRWNGDPFDALIDLDAYYQTRAPLYDLMPSSANAEELKKRFPVQCHMMLTNNLLTPNIKFEIVLPTADEETQRSVESVINTQDELNRQVISLLAMNRFYTPDYMRSNLVEEYTSSNQAQAAAVTASEFLSSQLSNWLSQISKDFDFGVHYRPGDNNYTSTEVELALSSQLWDDRIEINGNVGYRDSRNTTTAQSNTSNFVGDFEVFVKLNQQFRLKAYSRSNDNIYYETSPTTQGIGIIYREEFNDFVDLREMQKKRKQDRKNKRREKQGLKKEDVFTITEKHQEEEKD